MERHDRAALATFFVESPLVAGESVQLSETAAHHALVRRIGPGERIRLTNGAGTRATADVTSARKNELSARVLDTASVPRPQAIHLRTPIADRDRMLWLAEKVTELGVASWQAVRFRRSASVSPRGEGPAFGSKLRARMIGALEQSGGGWLPEVLEDVEPGNIGPPTAGDGYLLDQAGAPFLSALSASAAEITIVLGPEGGMEADELELLLAGGWRSVRVAATTLRFETAALAAVAIARATTLTEDA